MIKFQINRNPVNIRKLEWDNLKTFIRVFAIQWDMYKAKLKS